MTPLISHGKIGRKVKVMAKKNNNITMDITIATNNLEKAVSANTASSKAVAEILNTINERELYKECNVDSFKAWIDNTHNGDVFGIGYKQAKSLIDCFNHVWKHAELANIPSGTASALVSACKKDSAKVIALAKAGKITPNTSQKTIRELLVKEGLRKDSAKVIAKGADTMVDDIAIVEKALKVLIASLEKKGKTEDIAKIAKAWDNIKVAIDK